MYRALPITYDGAGLIELDGSLAKSVSELLEDPKKNSEWTTPCDIPLRMGDPLYVANWIYKSCNPIIHPEASILKLKPNFGDYLYQDTLSLKGNQARLSILAFGDISSYPNPEHIDDGVFSLVGDLFTGKDLRFGNLESTVSRGVSPSSKSTGVIPPKLFISQVAASNILANSAPTSFNLLSIANNHICDGGVAGLHNTNHFLKGLNIGCVGGKAKGDRLNAEVVWSNGVEVRCLAVTFGNNFQNEANSRINQISFSDECQRNLLLNKIIEMRKDFGGLLLVSLHWGEEFEMFPRAWQVEFARSCADAGADAIIGHHPHVAQPVEFYRLKCESRVVPIAYSLGNVIPPIAHPASALSLALSIDCVLAEEGSHLRPKFSSIRVEPLVTVLVESDGTAAVRVVKLSSFEDRAAFGQDEYLNGLRTYNDVRLHASKQVEEI